VSGLPFNRFGTDFVDAIAFIEEPKSPVAGVKARLLIIAADHPALCATGAVHQNSIILSIDAQSGDSPPKPGTFTQTMDDGPGQVDVGLTQLSATCGSSGTAYGAEIANVVVSEITVTSVKGTFAVTFPGAVGTLQGSFNAPICAKKFDATCNP
jgi:hypothetical protein